MKQDVKAYRAFHIGFSLLYLLLFGLCLLRHDNPFLSLGRWRLAAVAGLCALLFFAAWFIWQRWVPATACTQLHALTVLILYGVALVAFGLLMQVRFVPGWDFPAVAGEARDFVLQGQAPGIYFAYYPNNAPLFWVYVGWFSLLRGIGVQDLMSGLVVLNCGCILFSLYCLYRMARLLWGAKQALFILYASLLYPAFLLYAPIAYTDTLTMPFASAAALLWLQARRWQAQKGVLAKGRVLAAFALVGLGSVLKISTAILAVAFVLDYLLCWRGRGRLMVLALALACFALPWTAGNAASRTPMPDYAFEPIPHSHWVMMGLRGTGGYCDEDYQLTLQYDTYDQRAAFIRQEIGRRLQAMGPGGFVSHCLDKLSYIFSDGCCYAPEKLDRGVKTPNPLHEWIVSSGKYSGNLYYAADGLQLCLLALCAAGALRALVRRDNALAVLRVALIGLILFLLLWEARSRYLVNFLPFFLLCAASGLPGLQPAAEPAAEDVGERVREPKERRRVKRGKSRVEKDGALKSE